MKLTDKIILTFVFSSFLLWCGLALLRSMPEESFTLYEQMECDYDTGVCYSD